MKVRLATLLWFLTIVAVAIASWIQTRRVQQQAAAEIADVKSKMDQAEQVLNKWARKEAGKNGYFREQLGAIQNWSSLTLPYIKLIRLPKELGGFQSWPLPFTWHWKLLVDQPYQFELCWAIDNIPADDSFDLPVDDIHRSHLDLESKSGQSGYMSLSDSIDLSGKAPLEVNLFVRLDGDAEGGSLSLTYEISEPVDWGARGASVYRTQVHPLRADDVSFLQKTFNLQGGYGSLSGLGVEQGSSVPLLDQSFSWDQPIQILKLRAQNKLGPVKFENFEGPSPGLMIWIQRKE